MKFKKVYTLLLLAPFLASCALPSDLDNSSTNENPTEDTAEDTQEEIQSDSLQDANILHAWNWKMNDIKSRLTMIKNAGYEAIQISPMQPNKDKLTYANQSTSSQWWKIYQPLAFKVSESGESLLGTKTELTSLCTEAKKKGIKIIADVVANHLASDDHNSTIYHNDVYVKYPTHSYNGDASDSNGRTVVEGRIGMPDLDTSNSDVQEAVLGLLEEYIDCGVSGFRFDAAKHIETPDDGSYASNFWTYILDGAKQYAISKGLAAPYYYGEVLNTPGQGRSWESYTKLMSICDNQQGDAITDAVKNNQGNQIKTTYNTGVNPDHLVLWAESHDNYANTDDKYRITRDYSLDVINRSYMIQASRKDAATLYLARIGNIFSDKICTVNNNSGWKNAEIKAINDFHTHYVGQSEHISTPDGKYFVNVRGSGAFAGAAIININGSSTATISVNGLEDGDYTDLASNKTFSVSDGSVNAKFTNGACILVPKGAIK